MYSAEPWAFFKTDWCFSVHGFVVQSLEVSGSTELSLLGHNEL